MCIVRWYVGMTMEGKSAPLLGKDGGKDGIIPIPIPYHMVPYQSHLSPSLPNKGALCLPLSYRGTTQ